MPTTPFPDVVHTGTFSSALATMFTSSVPAVESAEPQPLDPNGTTGQDSPRGPRQHTASEWQSKRSLIKRLYIDLDKPLTQVMAIMSQDHNFHAT
jgi:hypothetical protein